MVYLSSAARRSRVCERVKQVRIDQFGEGYGAQKSMARVMGIPYTTYRGYEQNRTNDEFLRALSTKFNKQLYWLFGEERETEGGTGTMITIDLDAGPVESGRFKVFRMIDDSMDPLIPQGSWFGVEPTGTREREELNGNVVAYRQKSGTTARRAVIKKDMIIGIPVNPAYSGRTVSMQKRDIIGRVVWIFTKL